MHQVLKKIWAIMENQLHNSAELRSFAYVRIMSMYLSTSDVSKLYYDLAKLRRILKDLSEEIKLLKKVVNIWCSF